MKKVLIQTPPILIMFIFYKVMKYMIGFEDAVLFILATHYIFSLNKE